MIWKVAGQQQRRLLSIFSGASISGVADAVHVKIQDQNGVFFSLQGANITYKVAATLSKGVRPTTMQPPTLISTPGVRLGINPTDIGNEFNLQVPQDAGVISANFQFGQIGGNAVTIGDAGVAFLNQSGGVIGEIFPFIQTGWVPLPPGTFSVLATNNSPLHQSLFCQIIWGIEG